MSLSVVVLGSYFFQLFHDISKDGYLVDTFVGSWCLTIDPYYISRWAIWGCIFYFIAFFHAIPTGNEINWPFCPKTEGRWQQSSDFASPRGPLSGKSPVPVLPTASPPRGTRLYSPCIWTPSWIHWSSLPCPVGCCSLVWKMPNEHS